MTLRLILKAEKESITKFGPWENSSPSSIAVIADSPLAAYVNGELKQDGNTRDMIFSIGEILEFITSIMTLLPGDVISTAADTHYLENWIGFKPKVSIQNGMDLFLNWFVKYYF